MSAAPTLFIPDRALHFRPLPEQYRVVQAMRTRFDAFLASGYSRLEALYFAYVLENPNQHAVATAVGAGEFHRRMTEYLRQAQSMVEHVIDRYLRPFAGRLDAHNAVANCLDPIAMLLMATDPLPPHASALSRQRHLEALRQLAIALQLFGIEMVDDEAWVAEDLSQIDQLSWERLFLAEVSKYLWVLVEQDAQGVAKRVEIFPRAKDKTSRVRTLRRQGVPFKEELLSCRIAQIGGRRFYVYAINRRKRLLSTLLKLERGRENTDRRGWKYVVVATGRGANGKLSVATQDDARAFNEHTHRTLWCAPLYSKPDTSPPNPDSYADYRDEKIIGCFHRADNGRTIAGSCEQLTMTITQHVDTLFARDGVNQFFYRARKIVKYLAPLWFPHRRDVFEGVHGIALPGYGVAWDKPYFRKQLEDWWMSQL